MEIQIAKACDASFESVFSISAIQANMNDAMTEMEVSVKERMVKAVNVPVMVCPKRNKFVVEELVDKLVQKAAKHCKDDAFDYPKEVKVFGFGKAKR